MQRRGTATIVRAIEAMADRIVAAIQEASREQQEHRADMIDHAGELLRAALDEGAPRTVVLDPPVANDQTAGARPPPGAPANETEREDED